MRHVLRDARYERVPQEKGYAMTHVILGTLKRRDIVGRTHSVDNPMRTLLTTCTGYL